MSVTASVPHRTRHTEATARQARQQRVSPHAGMKVTVKIGNRRTAQPSQWVADNKKEPK